MTWNRLRFYVNPIDSRPVVFPPPGPWWESGFSEDFSVVVAVLPAGTDILHYWPDAYDIDVMQEGLSEIPYSDRFPEPEWWKEIKHKTTEEILKETRMSAQLKENITPAEMGETLDSLRPPEMAHIGEIESPYYESWDLATALHATIPLANPTTANERHDLHTAYETLQGYYGQCKERGGRTPEQNLRDRLRALLPFAERDCNERAKLAEDTLELNRVARHQSLVQDTYTQVDRWAAETRGETLDQLIARIVPLNER